MKKILKPQFKQKFRTFWKFLFPFILFFLVLAITVFLISRLDNSPYIENISPDVGSAGNLLLIQGMNFGEQKGSSEVIIAGVRPVLSAYHLWTDNSIQVRIPKDVTTGLVYIRTNDGQSNYEYFANEDALPFVLQGPVAPGQPYLESISPVSGAIGTELVLSGLNFGLQRGTVLFPSGVGDLPGSTFIACSNQAFEIAAWDEQEVRVYVPDGAVSGNITVVTDSGESNSMYFEVRHTAGQKSFSDKRGYQLNYSVSIENVISDESIDNVLDFWVPRGYNRLEQSVDALETSSEPMWKDLDNMGYMRFQLQNPEPWRMYTYSFQVWLERYKLETDLVPTAIPVHYNQDRGLFAAFTSADTHIPSDHSAVTSLSRQIIGRNTHPYHKARAIYNYIIRNFSIDAHPSHRDLLAALEERSLNTYTAALLTTSLLRAASVPSRPVAGIFITDTRTQVHHFWVEYYLEAVGWVPMDPGLVLSTELHLSAVDNPSAYYFHNIDANRITFSKGFAPLRPLLQNSRTQSIFSPYSFQPFFEEFSAGISGFSSRWSPVRVVEYW